MNIEDVQQWVKDLLDANPALSTVTKLIDNGTYPKTPNREEALNTSGLVIIVYRLQFLGLKDAVKAGVAVQEVYAPIIVEENVTRNRAVGGTGIEALAAVRHVQSSLIGKKPNANSPFHMTPMAQPVDDLGILNGVSTYVVNFEIPSPISPA